MRAAPDTLSRLCPFSSQGSEPCWVLQSLSMVTQLLCERGLRARAEGEVRGEPQLWNPS